MKQAKHRSHFDYLPFVRKVSSLGVLDSVHRPVFYKIENITFRKLDLFSSSGKWGEVSVPLGPLERANPTK
jgi:hypothetical protein